VILAPQTKLQTYLLTLDNRKMSNRVVGQREEQLAVETAGTTQSWVDVTDTVGSADDVDLSAVVDAVHQTEQCRDEARVLVRFTRATDRRQTVQLVDEDQARLSTVCLIHAQTYKYTQLETSRLIHSRIIHIFDPRSR